MENSKDFFASKTTWGVLITAAALILNHYGIQFNADDLAGNISSIVQNAGPIIGVLLTLWGRVSANTKISGFLGYKLVKVQ